jgi:chlorobactene glucosyltransferase
MLLSVVGAIRGGADVVTAFPEQELGSWSEALAVPFMLFTIWTLLPVGRVWSDPSPQAAAANGQLLAFARAAYDTIGGHAAVRNAVLDDMGLARRAKRAGQRLRLADGVGTVRTRMYRTADETWRGFSKNAFSLVGDTIWGALGLSILLLMLYVFPVIVAIVGFASGHQGWAWRWLPLALIGMMLIQRAIVVVRGRLPLWQIVLQPVSVLAFVAILANSLRWHRRGYGEWKGRRFAMSGDRSRGARE